MQLRDEGKLRLEDPVKDHLPEFSIAIKHPNARPVTIRGLLTHSSGIPREAASAYWQDFKFPTTAEVVERMKSDKVMKERWQEAKQFTRELGSSGFEAGEGGQAAQVDSQ